jgi:hypothetical protein
MAMKSKQRKPCLTQLSGLVGYFGHHLRPASVYLGINYDSLSVFTTPPCRMAHAEDKKLKFCFLIIVLERAVILPIDGKSRR